MSSGKEASRDPTFVAPCCEMISETELLLAVPGTVANTKPYDPLYGDYFYSPPSDMKNHFLWDFVSGGGPNDGQAILIHDLIEKKFRELEGPIYFFEPYRQITFSVKCVSFKLGMLIRFLQFANYSQHVIAVKPSAKLVLYFDARLEFCIYSRDAMLHPSPFPGVSDQELIDFFKNDLPFPSDDMFQDDVDHIRRQILPNCLEHGLV
jgi:hypothetical protein